MITTEIYANVILPLPLAEYYTYRIPPEMLVEITTGCRVIVPFGKKKSYTAIVAFMHRNPPVFYETKDIAAVLDSTPVVTQRQLELWKWIAAYYQCTLGEVYKAALPAGLKLESETTFVCNPDCESDDLLSEKEQHIMNAFLVKEKYTLAELEKASGVKNILPSIKRLLEKNALFVHEEMRNSYKVKTESFIRLAEEFSSEESMHRLFDELSRAPKQLHVLMRYMELSKFMSGKPMEVNKKLLSADATAVSALIKKNIFHIYTKQVERLKDFSANTPLNPLNDSQQRAYLEVKASFENKNITLLHGVTSSGKTEVYIHLIAEVLRQGQQALYLLPEIALTTQITDRMSRVFGNRLNVYHSKFSDSERVEVWNRLIRNEGGGLVLGVRSSVFLPFRDLALVIVDEEHENTYKQFDPAPRYHARNTVLVLAGMFGAKTLLGSATPSVESYFHAKSGKYGLVEMNQRFDDMPLPDIEVVDTGLLYKRKQMVSHFSPSLLAKIKDALESNEQVILFQNRRGFAPVIECKLCAWTPKCRNCDVSLTYHKHSEQLTCHYCGYAENVQQICPACGNQSLIMHGFGTEKIEEEIAALFPQAVIARMDLDTARTRTSYTRLIADFESGKTNILIGTQMVSKGLDFDHVSIVGILNADTMINYPDFRAHERAFQLMAQVAGRAGRKNKRGLVVLQTSNPQHAIIQKVQQNDYPAMFNEQIAERKMFRYPPFTRLIYIIIKHREQSVTERAATLLAIGLRRIFGNRILGPDRPVVERIQALFIRKIVLKVEVTANMDKVKEILNHQRLEILKIAEMKSVYIYYDVDPM
ncbi:MAG: primosomal protein N' [Bacteroidales bacterium]|jgi:primosomal protein N' (replication factor Y)|nr:primosomal protein N' [Bacteroidales bacterium]